MPLVMTSPDDDVAQAIAAKWDTSATLAQQVPGGLEQDRGTDSQPDAQPRQPRKSPDALFKVLEHGGPDLSTGFQAIDHRRVVIEIRGLKAAVSAAVDSVIKLYHRQPLPMFSPCVTADRDGTRHAMAVLLLGTDELRKDEKIVAGEDVWIGNVDLWVRHQRSTVPVSVPG